LSGRSNSKGDEPESFSGGGNSKKEEPDSLSGVGNAKGDEPDSLSCGSNSKEDTGNLYEEVLNENVEEHELKVKPIVIDFFINPVQNSSG